MSTDMRQKVVGYLLGELPPDEEKSFEAGLQIDPALRAEVDRLRPVVSRLEGRGEEVWDPPEPPPLDIAAIVAADATATGSETAGATAGGQEAQPGEDMPGVSRASGGAPARRPRRSLAEVLGVAWPRVAVGALSALFLLAAGVGVGLQLGGDDALTDGGPVQTVQLDAFGEEVPPGASGEVLMTSGDGATSDRMTLDVSGLEQSGDREFYELWLLGEKGELIALGSFRVPPDGSSTIEVPLPVNPERYRYFDISIQPENGDPQHSGRSVLRGLTNS
jgi:anti-sigma-K factor RskA